jgi:hypothetical protein
MGDFGHCINKEILFSTEANYTFLSARRQRTNEGNISPSMAIVLSQLFHYSLHPSIKNLYYKEKGTNC